MWRRERSNGHGKPVVPKNFIRARFRPECAVNRDSIWSARVHGECDSTGCYRHVEVICRDWRRICAWQTASNRCSAVHPGTQKGKCSGGEPLVAMMQAADLRKGDDLSSIDLLDRPTVGAVLVPRKVRAGAMVIVDIRRKDPPQVAFIENDDVIEALPSDRADHPLHEWVLPRRAWCRYDFLDVQGLDPGADYPPVCAVPATDHVVRRRIPTGRLR